MARWSLPEGVTRDSMDADILIVGGGSAGMAAACKIGQLLDLLRLRLKRGSWSQPIYYRSNTCVYRRH